MVRRAAGAINADTVFCPLSGTLGRGSTSNVASRPLYGSADGWCDYDKREAGVNSELPANAQVRCPSTPSLDISGRLGRGCAAPVPRHIALINKVACGPWSKPKKQQTLEPAPRTSGEQDEVGSSSHATDAQFCSEHDCIGNFETEGGTVVECSDGTYSHAGGISGTCSDHGGELGRE